MARWILLASLLVTAGSMSGVAGAPRLSAGLLGAANNAGNNNLREHPKEELELENLKVQTSINAGSGKLSGGQAAGSPTGKPPVPATSKPAVNMEHPAPSDNDNENSERYQAKMPVLSVSLPEDKRMKDVRLLGKGGSSSSSTLEPDYTPQDIAEYIFWTGDERGVAMALNDFVQDDLVTKNDVLRFLEDVKSELNAIRNRYSTVTQSNPLSNFPSSSLSLDQEPRSHGSFPKPKYLPESVPAVKRDFLGDYMTDSSNYDSSWPLAPQQQETPHTASKYPSSSSSSSSGSQGLSVKGDKGIIIPSSSSSSEDLPDYEEMIEKIRQADAKFREYSLEGIIYQLAKELFSQELHEQPQRSIQRFAHFVENEAELGRIPKDLGKAVLDTLVGALVDAVNEQSSAPSTPAKNKPTDSGSVNKSMPKMNGVNEPNKSKLPTGTNKI